MSYNQMVGGSHPNRNSYVPEYDNSAYKIVNPSNNFSQYPPSQVYSSQNTSSSVALFHIPSDGTNSLYVDGVPNDTTEREVSRKSIFLNRYFPSISRFSMHSFNKENNFNWKIIFLVLR